jgi:hypothetical protein
MSRGGALCVRQGGGGEKSLKVKGQDQPEGRRRQLEASEGEGGVKDKTNG